MRTKPDLARTVALNQTEALSTRERLLAGAADLFRRKGYLGTTTRELSAVLGIQNGSLYYHMEKKEDLLYKMCRVALEDVSDELAATAVESDPLQRLSKMMRAYVALALVDRDRHATMLVELKALSKRRRDEIVRLRDRNVAVVESTIVQAQQRSQLRADISAKYLTLAMFNMANWSIFWFRPDGELSPGGVADILCTVFLEGAVPRPFPASGKTQAARTKTRIKV